MYMNFFQVRKLKATVITIIIKNVNKLCNGCSLKFNQASLNRKKIMWFHFVVCDSATTQVEYVIRKNVPSQKLSYIVHKGFPPISNSVQITFIST